MAASAPRYIPNIKAVGVMIMAVPPAVFEQAVAGGGAYPPVIFLHMPRDEMMGTYVVQARHPPTACIAHPHRRPPSVSSSGV